MANYKLVLEEDFRDDFKLLAIHCSIEPYKMAYLLNKHALLRLKRSRRDLDFSKEGLEITFPWFYFEDEQHYVAYDLLANKCKTEMAQTIASGGLFSEENPIETTTHFVLPEFKQADFLLKITSENEKTPIKKLLLSINEIDQVISAYTIATDQLKSKNNLIFD